MRSELTPDITPETHPGHHTVGHDFMGTSWKHSGSARWYCKSHDAAGYNMVNRADPEDEKNISERAIGRTFHQIYMHPDGSGGFYEHSQWGPVKIDKNGQPRESGKVLTDA